MENKALDEESILKIKQQVVEKLRNIGETILDQINKGENPYLEIPIRHLSNVKFNKEKRILELGSALSKRYYLDVGAVRKFVQTLAVASVSKELIEEKTHAHLRDIFYMLKKTLPNTNIDLVYEQTESDKAIEDLELITSFSREQLNIGADKRGVVAGEVVIEDNNDIIDWSKMGSGGWSIPSNTEELVFKKVNADFVLVMEKNDLWERLNEDKVWKKLHCIIMGTQGQATRGTRRLLQRLNSEYNLPVYVLTDFDPWGIYIYSVIKFGSINLAHESERLALPQAKFVGLRYDDISKYNLKKHIIKFKDVDFSRLDQISNYDWFKNNKEWQEELNKMKNLAGKVELNALAANGIKFISERYIPEKIKEGEFLD
ncbi:MAG: DNA topoisomerase IV subunit A [Candidatus Rehaiarchaeum fermentans]|nr:DNA topoisomerase IV subunit A [Candidatus Rehaiarchaeum fermentans]